MNKDFDIDDILNQDDLFKPITKGLGFHHSVKDKKDVAISLKQKSSDLKRDLNIRTRKLAKESKIASETIDMGELAPFYKKDSSKTVQTINLNLDNESFKNSEVETVNILKRFFAYSIDLSLLFTALSVAFVASLYSTGMSFNTSKLLLRDPLSFILFTFITSLFYVLYFTFLDKGSFSSIGKRILNIKLVSLEGELTFSQTFHRSCLSLLSLLSAGLFNLLKLEDKLTNTTVVNQD